MALVAAACGDSDDADGGDDVVPVEGLELVRSESALADHSSVPDADVADVVTADTALGVRLLELIGDDGDNVIISPYSVASALGMLLPGTRGETRDQLLDVLGVTDEDSYHAGRGAVDARVNEPGTPPPEGDAEVFTLRAVNQVFAQDGFPIEDDYLDVLARDYGAGVALVDFAQDPEGSRQIVNEWVEDQTEDRIVDLVPEGVITTLTRLVLTNAVYFFANWEHQFDVDETRTGPFTRADGSTVDVPLMRTSARLGFVEGDGYRAARLPYAGFATSMLVIAPDDLAAFVADLSTDTVTDILDGLSDHEVDLTMPRVEFRTEAGLKPVLQQLGLVKAFEPPSADGADLTGIHPERVLFVQDAVHHAFVSIDEFGTEAAAATAVVIGLESAPPPAELRLDRPWLFMILHDETGEPLFVGQVTDPS